MGNDALCWTCKATATTVRTVFGNDVAIYLYVLLLDMICPFILPFAMPDIDGWKSCHGILTI